MLKSRSKALFGFELGTFDGFKCKVPCLGYALKLAYLKFMICYFYNLNMPYHMFETHQTLQLKAYRSRACLMPWCHWIVQCFVVGRAIMFLSWPDLVNISEMSFEWSHRVPNAFMQLYDRMSWQIVGHRRLLQNSRTTLCYVM